MTTSFKATTDSPSIFNVAYSGKNKNCFRKGILVAMYLTMMIVIVAGCKGESDNKIIGTVVRDPPRPINRMNALGGTYTYMMLDIAANARGSAIDSGKMSREKFQEKLKQVDDTYRRFSDIIPVMQNEDQKVVATLLSTLRPDPAVPLFTDQGNLIQERILKQFEERKPEYDKVLSHFFNDKELFAKASQAVTKQVIQGYGLSLVDPLHPDSDFVPGTDRKLADKLQGKLKSYRKGIDPDAPNLGDVDTKNLTFGTW